MSSRQNREALVLELARRAAALAPASPTGPAAEPRADSRAESEALILELAQCAVESAVARRRYYMNGLSWDSGNMKACSCFSSIRLALRAVT